jgi:DNA modification methylase
MHQLISTVTEQGFEFRQKLYWHKSNPVPQLYGVKWQEAVEEAVIATQNTGDGHHFQSQRGQHHNVINTPLCSRSERRDHPTQKPVELFRTIIKWWTEPGDTVLDPFAGTGTTLAAAKQLGRQYIGIEKQPKHVQTARNRLHQKSLHRDWNNPP